MLALPAGQILLPSSPPPLMIHSSTIGGREKKRRRPKVPCLVADYSCDMVSTASGDLRSATNILDQKYVN
jgi:hypothetical protein